MKLNKITRRQFMQTAGVVAAAGALAACSSDSSSTTTTTSTSTSTSTTTSTDSSSEAKELGVYWWGNQVRNEGTQAALDLYAEQNPGVTFSTSFAEWADFWTKMATNAASHTMEDIVQMDHAYINQYVSNGLLADLTPYITDGTLDISGISDSIMAASTIDGGIYAICIGINAPALLYNKTLMDSIDVTIDDYMTLDEFADICRLVYEETGVKTNFSWEGEDSLIAYFVRATGQHLYSDTSFGVSEASELALWYEFMEMGMAEGWYTSPEIFIERTTSVETNPLVMGDTPDQRSWCAYAFSNQLEAYQAAADAEGITLDITTTPSPDPELSNYLKPGQFFSVSVDAKYPEEAAKVIDYWTNSLECNEILMAERGVPASAATAEALNPSLSELQQDITDYINNVVTPCCSPIDDPYPDAAAEIKVLCNDLQEKVLYGQMTAEEAAIELFEDGNKALGG